MLGWHDTPWMWLSMAMFWSLVIAFAFYAIKSRTRSTSAKSGPHAVEILDERYARGEISAEQTNVPETPQQPTTVG
jgi:uncharacterized membrane protein